MSVYQVNYLCRELLRDKAFRAAMQEDPARALAGRDLSDAERDALLRGDVGALYRQGANEFLLGYLMRFRVAGLTLPLFNARMRAQARP